MTKHMSKRDQLAVFFWRVQSKPDAREIRINEKPGSFDITKDGVCTSAKQEWCDEIFGSRLAVFATRVAKPYGMEQAWVLRDGVLTSLKFPSFAHKLSRDDVRISCEPLAAWVETVIGKGVRTSMATDEYMARGLAVAFLMTSEFGNFSPVPRFGYGLATRLGFHDASKLPPFDGHALAQAVAALLASHGAPVPEMVVLDGAIAAMDCDALVDFTIQRLVKKKKKKKAGVETETMQLPALGQAFEEAMAVKDGKLRLIVRTEANSDQFLVMQHTRNQLECQVLGVAPHECTVLPQPFAANWVCVLGAGVVWGYARTPRLVDQAARVVATTTGLVHNDCPICLESVGDGPTSVAVCGHVMHETCFAKHVGVCAHDGVAPLCPTCRAPMGVELKGLTKAQRRGRLAEHSRAAQLVGA